MDGPVIQVESIPFLYTPPVGRYSRRSVDQNAEDTNVTGDAILSWQAWSSRKAFIDRLIYQVFGQERIDYGWL